ncbi:phytanoyl-CoA dioxygenase family protein [Catenovulum maritimum]|uniref:Phytanoyl-CoA dioxygenase n=1 Tax=Catenovulum maritimum TaxID=1513271 RepID=A0A0J8H0Q1_9ALTE|nr:phytanoyl-CoA dioxygenase family protein [Catenovulum maritimum]KMT66593.1 hypothetical protein XM47_03415 [Catenovulum maritimum]
MYKKLSFFSDKDAAVKQYNELGFHIEYDVYTESECEEIIALGSTLSTAMDHEYKPVMMPHRENSLFLKYMKNSKVVAIMQSLLQGNVSGLQSQFFYMQPGTMGFTPHQDNYFVQANNDAFASAWLALEDTSSENGGLIVYPGSHKEGMLPVEESLLVTNTAQDPNAYKMLCVVPDTYQPISVSIPKGAVLFIHACIVHASNNNESDNLWRHVLLNTYIRSGCSFRPGRDAKREEIDLSQV